MNGHVNVERVALVYHNHKHGQDHVLIWVRRQTLSLPGICVMPGVVSFISIYLRWICALLFLLLAREHLITKAMYVEPLSLCSGLKVYTLFISRLSKITMRK